jgi:hypothetical protein
VSWRVHTLQILRLHFGGQALHNSAGAGTTDRLFRPGWQTTQRLRSKSTRTLFYELLTSAASYSPRYCAAVNLLTF